MYFSNKELRVYPLALSFDRSSYSIYLPWSVQHNEFRKVYYKSYVCSPWIGFYHSFGFRKPFIIENEQGKRGLFQEVGMRVHSQMGVICHESDEMRCLDRYRERYTSPSSKEAICSRL